MAKYNIAVTLNPPPALDLTFWWENVTVGEGSAHAYNKCQMETLTAGGTLEASIIDRPPPPGYDVSLMAVGVVGAAIAVTVLVAIILQQTTASKFHKRARK